jgi:DNA-directed RNA polymerase specialized sigma24 family protein
MDLHDPWDEYVRLQQQADRRKIDAKSWAAEEQANEFLDAIADRTLKSPADAREIWLENLATNRAKKHRRRAALLHKYQFKRPTLVFSNVHDSAVHNEGISRVQQHTSTEEWRILLALASGEKYAAVSKAIDCSIAALKARVSRCRQRLSLVCG